MYSNNRRSIHQQPVSIFTLFWENFENFNNFSIFTLPFVNCSSSLPIQCAEFPFILDKFVEEFLLQKNEMDVML